MNVSLKFKECNFFLLGFCYVVLQSSENMKVHAQEVHWSHSDANYMVDWPHEISQCSGKLKGCVSTQRKPQNKTSAVCTMSQWSYHLFHLERDERYPCTQNFEVVLKKVVVHLIWHITVIFEQLFKERKFSSSSWGWKTKRCENMNNKSVIIRDGSNSINHQLLYKVHNAALTHMGTKNREKQYQPFWHC